MPASSPAPHQRCPRLQPRASEAQIQTKRWRGSFETLRAGVVMSCLLLPTIQGFAQPPAQAGDATAKGTTPPAKPSISQSTRGLPAEPQPNYTQPLFMRPSDRDYTRSRGYFPNPIAPYIATSAAPPRFDNTLRLDDLLKNGKIYLSLSDAIMLAIENNFDIEIQRYNLDIADTDLLRARSGSTLLGVNNGLVTGTIGGATAALSSGGGPGGTTSGAGGASSGSSGLALTTNGGGPLPEALDPVVSGTVQLERERTQELNLAFTGVSPLDENLNIYNFAYSQGFLTGTQLQVTFDNQYATVNSPYQSFSPSTQATFNAQLTQHLLRGFGTGINGRFIAQAKNNRRVSDSAFRQQILYTVNQVENIYWGLVSAYEDVQAKERALAQSSQLESDDRKQLEIGTLAPLDVVNAQSAVATDKEALVSSQSTLEYQQLVMKQAFSRNLEDPALTNAPVIPTDRVSLIQTPEESMPTDDLVRRAEANRPEIEQAALALKNDEITLRGEKNGLLPTLDGYVFYGASAVGGSPNPACLAGVAPTVYGCDTPNGVPVTSITYGTVFQNTFNNSFPNKGAGVTLSVPIRNRAAQSEQARSVLEYRQAQMRLQQLYVQVRMQVINSQYALTNDRAQVQAAQAAREYAYQSLDAEQRKLKLGASTTAAVLQQERNLAVAENNAITARASYARDRATLSNTLADTLDRYGISLGDAVLGKVTQVPVIPGLEPPKPAGQEQAAPLTSPAPSTQPQP
jgi:outer membrane protein TolC